MAPIRHPGTGLFLGDPDVIPLQSINESTIHTELECALQNLILSASGWRTVFTLSGYEEDPANQIGDAHSCIVATAALVFSDYLKQKIGTPKTCYYCRSGFTSDGDCHCRYNY